jgi:hypothetical protein
LHKFPDFRRPIKNKSVTSCFSHVEKLNALRAEIDKGIHSLDANKGGALSMEDFLRPKNSGHGGA